MVLLHGSLVTRCTANYNAHLAGRISARRLFYVKLSHFVSTFHPDVFVYLFYPTLVAQPGELVTRVFSLVSFRCSRSFFTAVFPLEDYFELGITL